MATPFGHKQFPGRHSLGSLRWRIMEGKERSIAKLPEADAWMIIQANRKTDPFHLEDHANPFERLK